MGELGIDYTFAGDRAKNIALRRKYKVNDTKMKVNVKPLVYVNRKFGQPLIEN